MLINFSKNTFLNIYLISPLISLHKKDYKTKIIITFLFLVFYHYFSYIFPIIIFFYNLFTIASIPISYNKILNRLSFTSVIYIFLLNIILYINTIKLYKNYNFIPEFIIRIVCLPCTSYLCLKILFLTTKYEHVIIFFLYFIQIITQGITKKINFIAIVSSQIVLNINRKIYDITFSIQLRSMNKTIEVKYKTIYSSIIYEVLVFINTYIEQISSNLYIRKISYHNFRIIQF
uniref:Conserved hypothetical plastid protein n=1 Tax=Caulacanthus okamurae TaxID=152008 RepID=A0A6H1U790_9FLOR|nr:conserved hypothetical plastid protein [Caulacanthus okamurae]QIZ74714.1 conserved hypothetical plastid protein [Caulacanthus okamurae]